MPGQVPDDCTVTVATSTDLRCAEMRIAGEIDMDATPVLTDALSRLAPLTPDRVLVDLHDVTFAGSVLPNFLATMHAGLPRGTTIEVRHCRPLIRRVLRITGMAAIMRITDDLPDRVPGP